MLKAAVMKKISKDGYFSLGISSSRSFQAKDLSQFFPGISEKTLLSVIPKFSEFWIRITKEAVTVQILGGIEECIINPTDPFNYEISKIVAHGINYPLEVGANQIRLGRAPNYVDLIIEVKEVGKKAKRA